MKARSLIAFMIVLAAMLGFMSLAAHATTDVSQATASVSFTRTTTTVYQVTTGGNMYVRLNSVQLSNPPPQAYTFEVFAQTYPGLSITRIVWYFGDGAVLDVPYCCRSTVSEVQYHAYAQPRQYTVTVVVFDNAGNFGNAEITVDWVTPLPEYETFAIPLAATLIVALFGTAAIKKRVKQ